MQERDWVVEWEGGEGDWFARPTATGNAKARENHRAPENIPRSDHLALLASFVEFRWVSWVDWGRRRGCGGTPTEATEPAEPRAEGKAEPVRSRAAFLFVQECWTAPDKSRRSPAPEAQRGNAQADKDISWWPPVHRVQMPGRAAQSNWFGLFRFSRTPFHSSLSEAESGRSCG